MYKKSIKNGTVSVLCVGWFHLNWMMHLAKKIKKRTQLGHIFTKNESRISKKLKIRTTNFSLKSTM